MRWMNRLVRIFVVIGFLLTLYWVEVSPWGCQAVAEYNAGYGTFDMKTYNAVMVEHVLGDMEEEGFCVSYLYYLGDYLFILFFGATQALMSHVLCGKWKKAYQISMGAVFVRGMADFIENTLLALTLYQYPTVHRGMITSASTCTQIKLWCIKLWLISLLVGVIVRFLEKIGNYWKERKVDYGKAKG